MSGVVPASSGKVTLKGDVIDIRATVLRNETVAQSPVLDFDFFLPEGMWGISGELLIRVDFLSAEDNVPVGVQPCFVNNPKYGVWSMVVDVSSITRQAADVVFQPMTETGYLRHYTAYLRVLVDKALGQASHVRLTFSYVLDFDWHKTLDFFTVVTVSYITLTRQVHHLPIALDDSWVLSDCEEEAGCP